MKTIEKIRNLCKMKGTSVAQLEKALGFGNGSLAKSKNIRSDRLAAVAEYFGVNIDDLIDKGPEDAEISTPFGTLSFNEDNETTSTIKSDLIRQVQEMTDEQAEALLAWMRVFLNKK